MPRPVISVENLYKAYRIGLKDEIPDTLMGAMKNVATAPWRNFHRLRRLNTATATAARNTPAVSSPLAASRSPLTTNPEHVEATTTPDEADTLWALRDVSFTVNEGDVVGIIGRNGAGKSTLLKILSRITEPTSGRAVIRGRVSSLLEVGTGFHPELTGRENIYMNGTILGMTKREIDRKFDEITNFSGVEKFLDTPTKRYSSGMQVRLAFAVAAHLEPEILIVDEVLAVGDANFQAKCLEKMKDVAECGRSVLFVSHNLAAIQQLCSRGIVINSGQVHRDCRMVEAVDAYCRITLKTIRTALANRSDRDGTGPTRMQRIEMNGVDVNTGRASAAAGSKVCLKFLFNVAATNIRVSFTIWDMLGRRVAALDGRFVSDQDAITNQQSTCAICSIPEILLAPGDYTINTSIFCDANLSDRVQGAGAFTVTAGLVRGRAIRAQQCGVALIPCQWEILP